MRRFSVFCLVCLPIVLSAQEHLVLDTPKPAVTAYRITQVNLIWDDTCIVAVRFTANDGTHVSHSYRGPDACTMLQALNTANLSTKSLQRRILEKLVSDKVITGSIAGTPE